MLSNYLKIAYRNLLRSKAFSAINIVGLAFGLATCLIIGLFVLDELNYDRFHEKADRIVRVTFKANMSGNKINEATVMPPTAKTLQREYPEVLEATRLRQAMAFKLAKDDKVFKEYGVAFVDSNFLQVFTFPLVKGNPNTALLRPNTLVISEKMAQKYFGNEDPIGKALKTNNYEEVLEVTGVMADMPTHSHFHFDFLISMAGLAEAQVNSWMQSEFFTYLLLPDGYDYRQLQAKLPQVVEKYMGPEIRQAFGMNYAEFRKQGNELGLQLQPLTDIHLYADFDYDLGPSGDVRYVYMFGAIALFMLLIACINFMNLSTAGASKRAREVGIRKVMGSVKSTLVSQFLLESLLLTAVALVLAVALVWLALPFFNDLADKNLTLNFTKVPWLLPGLLLLGLAVGIMAGSYPAFFLSSFKPITVLKGGSSPGRLTNGRRSIGLRSTLVVVQFCISFVLIVGTAVVYQQLQFIQNAKLGYDKEQVLVLQGTYRLGQNEQLFKKQLLQDSRVVDVTVSGYVPAGPSYNNNFMVYGDDKVNEFTKGIRYDVDENYIPTLGMSMVAGRNFSPEFGTDSSAIILNETAAREMGWGHDAVGHTVTRPNNEGTKTTYHVIGVVKDFHFKSLHERITPLMMTLGHNGGAILAKVKTRDLPALITAVEKRWKDLVVDEPLEYSFLEENFNATYRAEQKTGQILGLFAGLTIFVACLGLFGLATFTAEQRTKEIGVRKVLGASVTSVVALLSKDFLKLVLIAILIATPVAWYAMHFWLQDFAYKIDIAWWVFALAGTLAVGIALLTVSFQSVKAALMNPVESLRSE
ncbi:ABC transporter permease [Rhabdobacter roseus]|uniref:Putative ABC transport system permease protein n=1 Tax=Rhabdobacter roseus TaxID=1655419 RepID=A0A840U0C4_9BACT|nr:ABC transporter permease [Rhabdobacter roseus]MBB5285590.1 putative ABC transport system permease protein [Rhabdobacter roseus]